MKLTDPRMAMSFEPFTARAATPALKAVPLRIPRCSFDTRGRGVVLVSARALLEVYDVKVGERAE